jgi:hypothetical protein
MKVNLIRNDDVAKMRNDDYTNLQFHQLDDIVDDAEAEEVSALRGYIEYFSTEESETVLNKLISKLKHGGRLILSFTDIIEVARDLSSYKLNIDDGITMIYGLQDKPENFKKAGFTYNYVAAFLRRQGLKIVKGRTQEYETIIEAERL